MAATYQPIAPDGADWRCDECHERGPAHLFWFITTANGVRMVLHKDCTEPDWIELAEFVPKPI